MVRKLEDIELPVGNDTLSSKLKDVKIEKLLTSNCIYNSPNNSFYETSDCRKCYCYCYDCDSCTDDDLD